MNKLKSTTAGWSQYFMEDHKIYYRHDKDRKAGRIIVAEVDGGFLVTTSYTLSTYESDIKFVPLKAIGDPPR